jgi:hypothetical protein
MRIVTCLKALPWLGAALILGGPATAFAHTFVVTPPPRDIAQPDLDLRAHKNGPCGGVPRTGKPTQYTVGETITVKWMETIGHQGCFQIGFSEANDTGFTVLKQINDPPGGAGTVYTDTVTLPAGVSCPACTIVVKQLMINRACTGGGDNGTTAPFQADDGTSTYYSCADVCVGPTCTEADAGAPADPGSTNPGADSGGPTTTDGGGKLVDGNGDVHNTQPNVRSGDGGGCSVALGPTSGVSFGLTAGLLSLALARGRRRKTN